MGVSVIRKINVIFRTGKVGVSVIVGVSVGVLVGVMVGVSVGVLVGSTVVMIVLDDGVVSGNPARESRGETVTGMVTVQPLVKPTE